MEYLSLRIFEREGCEIRGTPRTAQEKQRHLTNTQECSSWSNSRVGCYTRTSNTARQAHTIQTVG